MKASKEGLRKEYENLVKKESDKRLPSISYFDFLEQKIIAKPVKEKVSDEELEYPNLTCLVYGYELTTYQRLLAKKEYQKLIELKVNE
jgi:hypothetical protein